MTIELIRRRTLSDGRVEVFRPMKNADGYYVLADRAVDPQHNRAANQFYVKDLAAVAARLRRGGVSLRMRGDISGQPNLISAGEIEIDETPPEAVQAKGGAVEDDPFAAFSEWGSDADEAAYAGL
jgi:hypothetical protein